jgi:hypothetical protein
MLLYPPGSAGDIRAPGDIREAARDPSSKEYPNAEGLPLGKAKQGDSCLTAGIGEAFAYFALVMVKAKTV